MSNNTPPTYDEVQHLRSSTSLAGIHSLGNVVALLAGVTISSSGSWFWYVIGQLLLTLCLVHAFVLLHEAGHQTLFKRRWMNAIVGHYAGGLSLIPFASWRPIHARHHRYTGWQDLDATTATLIPRPLKPWEGKIIDFAWRTGTPLFSVLYRLQNYWHIPRINRFLKKRNFTKNLTINAVFLLILYALFVYLIGFKNLFVLTGPALLLSLAAEDILLLSQHTHIPQNLSHGERVSSFPPIQQAQFSRSLQLPSWLSKVLMHFDEHELHHMYPQIPGYRLNAIDYQPPNAVHWATWIRAAKKLTGTDFLFRNRRNTGSSV